ncbi:porin [Rhodosalinus sediminis]|uniref:Porin n=1 Tax=Rhodosalinus sediminis TaxID=1940533 RepID=A0A3D9BP27_9RHOB|nr:porin [Rhodosalinus sediminis]REC55279.1 porin [Rhodosalinus sediminis]
MQKLLFATTALVATAGMAAADVTFGGYARWGMEYVEDRDTETQIESRMRLIVTATTESDAGLSFGAQTRLNIDEDDLNTFNQPRFYVAYEGLEVSVGNTQGAFEFMPGMYTDSVGLNGLGYENVVFNYAADAYSSGGQGRQGIDVKYSMGALSAHLSYSTDETGGSSVTDGDDRLAAFLAYDVNGWTLAGGFQDVNDEVVGDATATGGAAFETSGNAYTNWVLTASGPVGPATIIGKIASNDYSNVAADLDGDGNADGFHPVGDDAMVYHIGATFDVAAATTVSGFINNDEALDQGDGVTQFGAGFVHDLGGGASVRGGVATMGNFFDDETITKADLGVQFSF